MNLADINNINIKIKQNNLEIINFNIRFYLIRFNKLINNSFNKKSRSFKKQFY